jgi:hypothetical protein
LIIELKDDNDPLNQMISKNCFPPIDLWLCPMCFERIDIYDDSDENTQWDVHLNLKHCIESFVFENICPFFLYGEAQPHFAFFYPEQSPGQVVLNTYKGDWDIDEKCPFAQCPTHFGNAERLKDHINSRHKSYGNYSKVNFPILEIPEIKHIRESWT